MSDNVVSIKPKTLGGRSRGREWSIIYNMIDRTWSWRVVILMEPQVFSGTVDTMQEAQRCVDGILKAGGNKASA